MSILNIALLSIILTAASLVMLFFVGLLPRRAGDLAGEALAVDDGPRRNLQPNFSRVLNVSYIHTHTWDLKQQ